MLNFRPQNLYILFMWQCDGLGIPHLKTFDHQIVLYILLTRSVRSDLVARLALPLSEDLTPYCRQWHGVWEVGPWRFGIFPFGVPGHPHQTFIHVSPMVSRGGRFSGTMDGRLVWRVESRSLLIHTVLSGQGVVVVFVVVIIIIIDVCKSWMTHGRDYWNV